MPLPEPMAVSCQTCHQDSALRLCKPKYQRNLPSFHERYVVCSSCQPAVPVTRQALPPCTSRPHVWENTWALHTNFLCNYRSITAAGGPRSRCHCPVRPSNLSSPCQPQYQQITQLAAASGTPTRMEHPRIGTLMHGNEHPQQPATMMQTMLRQMTLVNRVPKCPMT
jgi:hypothetical protein